MILIFQQPVLGTSLTQRSIKSTDYLDQFGKEMQQPDKGMYKIEQGDLIERMILLHRS
jgi:hypothetical protein